MAILAEFVGQNRPNEDIYGFDLYRSVQLLSLRLVGTNNNRPLPFTELCNIHECLEGIYRATGRIAHPYIPLGIPEGMRPAFQESARAWGDWGKRDRRIIGWSGLASQAELFQAYGIDIFASPFYKPEEYLGYYVVFAPQALESDPPEMPRVPSTRWRGALFLSDVSARYRQQQSSIQLPSFHTHSPSLSFF